MRQAGCGSEEGARPLLCMVHPPKAASPRLAALAARSGIGCALRARSIVALSATPEAACCVLFAACCELLAQCISPPGAVQECIAGYIPLVHPQGFAREAVARTERVTRGPGPGRAPPH